MFAYVYDLTSNLNRRNKRKKSDSLVFRIHSSKMYSSTTGNSHFKWFILDEIVFDFKFEKWHAKVLQWNGNFMRIKPTKKKEKNNQKYVIIGFQLIKMQNEREKKDLTVSDVSACGRHFDFWCFVWKKMKQKQSPCRWIQLFVVIVYEIANVSSIKDQNNVSQ